MNWDAIGAVGEIIGALAVVLSLVYLAGQIKSNTSALRRAASHDAVSAVNAWFSHVEVDNETANLFGRGVEDYNSLGPEEVARFRFIVFQFFKVAEDLHFQYEEGIFDEGQWEGWRFIFSQYLAAPGLREYWTRVSNGFSPRFRGFYASLDADTDFVRAGSEVDVNRSESDTVTGPSQQKQGQ